MVCSVVVVVLGLAGRTVVSSVVVVLLVVRGSSEAQPDSAPRAEASRQGSKSFFIILISLTGRLAPKLVVMVVVLLAGLNRTALMLVFVTVVIHVLAVWRHCRRRRRFGSGRMSFVIGATGKGDKREHGNAGEDQIFYHISFV